MDAGCWQRTSLEEERPVIVTFTPFSFQDVEIPVMSEEDSGKHVWFNLNLLRILVSSCPAFLKWIRLRGTKAVHLCPFLGECTPRKHVESQAKFLIFDILSSLIGFCSREFWFANLSFCCSQSMKWIWILRRVAESCCFLGYAFCLVIITSQSSINHNFSNYPRLAVEVKGIPNSRNLALRLIFQIFSAFLNHGVISHKVHNHHKYASASHEVCAYFGMGGIRRRSLSPREAIFILR